MMHAEGSSPNSSDEEDLFGEVSSDQYELPLSYGTTAAANADQTNLTTMTTTTKTAMNTGSWTDDDENDKNWKELEEFVDFTSSSSILSSSPLKDQKRQQSIIDEAMNLLNDQVQEAIHDFTSTNGDNNDHNSSLTSLDSGGGDDDDDEGAVTADDATQTSIASLSSIPLAEDQSTLKKQTKTNKQQGNEENNSQSQQQQSPEEQEDMVPLQQFQNALELIQDLEQRVNALEGTKKQLQLQNEQLRQETETQQKLILSYEKKLSEFPRLMEATIEEQSAVAAKFAKGVAKQHFWNEYMSRQEELNEQEKRDRRKTATTTSLKQGDFLKLVVERQEQERSHSAPTSFLQGWKSKFRSKGTISTNGAGHGGAGKPISPKKERQQQQQQHASLDDDGSDLLGMAANDAKVPSKDDHKVLSLLT